MSWIGNTSPTCDLCNAYDAHLEHHLIMMSSMSFSPVLTRDLPAQDLWVSVSSHRFPQFFFHNDFLSQNNKLYFFLHALIAFYRQNYSRTS